MANWKETLNIKDLHEAYKDESISVEDLCKKVHERCMKLSCSNDPVFIDIVSELQFIDDIDDYDLVLHRMYDYGDYKNRIWIKTQL